MLAALVVAVLWPHVPSPAAQQYFPADFLARSQAYARGNDLFYAGRTVAALLVLAWLAFRDGASRWGEWARARAHGRPVLAAVWLAVAVTLLLLAVDLPFAVADGFWWQHLYGLSPQPLGSWFVDLAKSWGISLVTQAMVFAVLFTLIVKMPRTWWLPAAVLGAAGIWLSTLLGPVAIDPLFYQFRPMPASPLKTELETMAREAGVPVRDVLIANASRRTNAINAYVAGNGPTRRLVVYDTLLKKETPDEVTLVVAHEIGHLKEHHIAKGLALGMPAAALAIVLLAWFLRVLARRGTLPKPSHPAAVVWILLMANVATLLAMPVENAISRTFERQADAISFRLAPHPQAGMALEKSLATENLANVDPNPYVEFLLYTHPTQLERLLAAKRAVGKG